MAKQDEIAYYHRLGEEGQRHSDGKPFTDAECGALLIDMGQALNLLPPPPSKILDVGCGTGWTSEFLSRAGYHVTGLDISPDMIEACRRLRSGQNLDFTVGDFEAISSSGSYDAILSFGSLHHCDDLNAALTSCFRALRTGGILLLLEPGEGHEDSETSREYVANYGLTERSLPPPVLRKNLSSVGFHNIQVFPRLSLFYSSLRMPIPVRSWKFRLIQSLTGERFANVLQSYLSTQKNGVVAARR